MYIDEYTILRAAGLDAQDTTGGGYRPEPLNTAQAMILASLYLGNKIDDLKDAMYPNNTEVKTALGALQSSVDALCWSIDNSGLGRALSHIALVLEKILTGWLEKHDLPQMRLLLQKVHSYHRRQA